MHAFAIEPLSADFPFARTLIVLRSERTLKRTSTTTIESRYYLSSAPTKEYSAQEWLNLIRGHWGGVEVRNHWRRDALMGEDRSRSRQANLLANVALIRNALLQILSERMPEQSLKKVQENLHSRPAQCLALIAAL